MLLRSSSTPVLGSLFSTNFSSESPNNNNNNNNHHHQIINKSPFHQHQIGCLNLTTVNSCSSSPAIADFPDSYYSRKGLRRAQSEGNIQGLPFTFCNISDNSYEDYQNYTSQHKKVPGRQKCLMLEPIPSFSVCNLRGPFEEEDEDEKMEVVANGSLSSKMEEMVLMRDQVGVVERSWNVGVEGWLNEEMYLARGTGIGGGGTSDGNGGGSGGRGGGEFHRAGGDGGDMQSTEEYYKKMLQENPGNPLFLRNYAQFLYQTKRDLKAAEEYCGIAMLADPTDGKILSQYAKLIWELHGDIDKASIYFERAVEASPEDSHMHAAYASFLWETEEDEDECNVPTDFDATAHFNQNQGAMASTSA